MKRPGITILIIVGFVNSLQSQNLSSPFLGLANIGTGISTVIDFQAFNNGASIPYELGIEALKYVNRNDYFQVGFNLSKRGSGYSEEYDYGTEASKVWHKLSLLYLDFRISYYHNINILKKKDAYLFFGLNNSYLLKDPVYSSIFQAENPDFYNYNLSTFIGLNFFILRDLSIAFRINQSLISIIEESTVLPLEFYISISYRLSR